jgi:hypothetical protein
LAAEGLEPGTGPYQQALREKRTGVHRKPTTQVNVGQSEYGTIPKGYQLKRGEDGSLSMVPIPGSPAAQEAEEEVRKQEQRTSQEQLKKGIVLEDIGRIKSIVDASKLPTTGFGATFTSLFKGTGASDIDKILTGVKSQIARETLQEMRDNSPTGGALGNVSNFEVQMLQAAYGSIEQAQSEPEFLFALTRLERIYDEVVNGSPDFNIDRRNQNQPPSGNIGRFKVEVIP